MREGFVHRSGSPSLPVCIRDVFWVVARGTSWTGEKKLGKMGGLGGG